MVEHVAPPAARSDRRFAVLTVLDALGIGALVTDSSGAVLQFNGSLPTILADFAPDIDVELFAKTFFDRIFQLRQEDDSPRAFYFEREGRRPFASLCLHMYGPLADEYLMVSLLDLHELVEPQANVVRSAFGLTRAEAEVAIRAARGRSAPQIARELQLSPGTVRVQLKAVFAKTYTRRQSELAAVVARAGILSRVPAQLVLSAGDFARAARLSDKLEDLALAHQRERRKRRQD